MFGGPEEVFERGSDSFIHRCLFDVAAVDAERIAAIKGSVPDHRCAGPQDTRGCIGESAAVPIMLYAERGVAVTLQRLLHIGPSGVVVRVVIELLNPIMS